MKENHYIENSGRSISLKNEEDITLSSILYSIEMKPYKHLYIHHSGTRPGEKQKGYHSILFKELEKFAKKETCKAIRSKTGTSEEYAGVRAIRKKYGFTFLPQTEMDKQRGRIGLEKTL